LYRIRVFTFLQGLNEDIILPESPRASFGDVVEVAFLRELEDKPSIGELVRLEMASDLPHSSHRLGEALGRDGHDGEEHTHNEEFEGNMP
jgi:hypothetical protein